MSIDVVTIHAFICTRLSGLLCLNTVVPRREPLICEFLARFKHFSFLCTLYKLIMLYGVAMLCVGRFKNKISYCYGLEKSMVYLEMIHSRDLSRVWSSLLETTINDQIASVS